MQRVASASPSSPLACRLLAPLALALAAGLGACSPAGALCARISECADDPPGPEFEEICRIQYNTNIDALKANEEEVCQDLAKAQEAFDACRAGLECVDFNEGDLNDRCTEERDALDDARDAVDGLECTAFD